MWNRINAIQVKGGTNFIISNIKNVEKTGEEVNKRISDLEIMIHVLTYQINYRMKNKKI